MIGAQIPVLGSLFLVVSAMQDWYVDANAPDCTGIGTLADPFCSVTDAVSAASDGDRILIAPGTYFENVLLDKDLMLIGTEGELVTILNGMASGNVVQVSDSVVTLIGLTLTNGVSGIFGTGTMTLRNSTVSDNAYLGIICGYLGYPATLTLTDSTVSGNGPQQLGGGVYSYGILTLEDSVVTQNYGQVGGVRAFGSGALADSIISSNTATPSCFPCAAFGGGVGVRGSLTVTNCLIVDNVAEVGAGITCAGPLTLTNSTVSGNLPGTTAVRFSYKEYPGDGGATITNSIIWPDGLSTSGYYAGPTTVDFTDVPGVWPGVGSIDADPLFVDPMNSDYHLLPGSPCIDAGNNTFLPRGITVDLLGLPRFVDDAMTPDTGIADFLPVFHILSGEQKARPVVDQGAYEFQ